jgi:ATP-binding cassette, subfamily D (ALD), peroxisomal long-chain fatty acid import protein
MVLFQSAYVFSLAQYFHQIRHLQLRLSLRLRTRLTRYTHDLYLSSHPHLRYYRISGQGGIDGVDQYITADVASWADSLSGL